MAKAKKAAKRPARKQSVKKSEFEFSIVLEKLGKVQRYALELDAAPGADFLAGFMCRSQDWLQGRSEPVERRFKSKQAGGAFMNGYHAARKQER